VRSAAANCEFEVRTFATSVCPVSSCPPPAQLVLVALSAGYRGRQNANTRRGRNWHHLSRWPDPPVRQPEKPELIQQLNTHSPSARHSPNSSSTPGSSCPQPLVVRFLCGRGTCGRKAHFGRVASQLVDRGHSRVHFSQQQKYRDPIHNYHRLVFLCSSCCLPCLAPFDT
jgi:hypothetical protein